MFKIKQLKNFTSKEIAQVSRLTNYAEDGGGSYMLQTQIKKRKERPITCAVLYYRCEKIIGWATVEKNCGDVLYCVFVAPVYRRKGIGSKLLKKAKEIAKIRFPLAYSSPIAWPWDDRGRTFYVKTFKDKIEFC